ncbi:hypothetical protein H6F44_00235 [Pseudanabaena sp. FACHB-1277]|jgi:hypothetical protein|uniref:Uncharacterized protein n=1 Tax=Pseudanabaena cinerea FACHB-1277 TaxID=2949581 RepID=A0A926Z4H4_9CYAN|nr:hypothetical protein [Pseudanabaena cinerea]MBD2148567.1 hypothetical protein [Pseudanabaena cinerea FACHB-1277]
MVAKRNIYPNFPPQVSRKANQPALSMQGGKRVVSVTSPRNLTTSLNNQANPREINDYSTAVSQNIQRNRDKYCRTKAIEAMVVIAVNIALSMTAIAAIAKLLPYHSSQKDRLDEINTEVKSVEQRVNSLRDKLPQTLNSGKSQELLLRNQGWIKHNQITIKLLDPSEVASPNTDGIITTTTTAQKISPKQKP